MKYIIFNGKKYSINDILELNNDFSKENIKRQYHLLSKKYHPDNYTSKDSNYDKMIEKTQLINLAYEEVKKNVQSEKTNPTKNHHDTKPKENTKTNVSKETEKLRIYIETILASNRQEIARFQKIIEEMKSIYNKNINRLDNDAKHLFKDIIINKYNDYYTNLQMHYNYLHKSYYTNINNHTINELSEIYEKDREFSRNNRLFKFYESTFESISHFHDFYDYVNQALTYFSANDIYLLVCTKTKFDKLLNSVCKKNNIELDDHTRKLINIEIHSEETFSISNFVNINFLNQIILKNKIEKVINNAFETYQGNRVRR